MFTRWYHKAHACAFMSDLNSSGYKAMLKKYDGTTVNVTASNCKAMLYMADTLKNPRTWGKTDYMSMGGVMFGDGNTPPTVDDFQLSGDHFTTYSSSVTHTYDPDANEATVTYTLTNTGSTDFTIREVGGICTSSAILAFREVLDSPVTIVAGGIGQVTIKIKT